MHSNPETFNRLHTTGDSTGRPALRSSGNVGGKSAPRASFTVFVARDRNFEKEMKESGSRPGPGAFG